MEYVDDSSSSVSEEAFDENDDNLQNLEQRIQDLEDIYSANQKSSIEFDENFIIIIQQIFNEEINDELRDSDTWEAINYCLTEKNDEINISFPLGYLNFQYEQECIPFESQIEFDNQTLYETSIIRLMIRLYHIFFQHKEFTIAHCIKNVGETFEKCIIESNPIDFYF